MTKLIISHRGNLNGPNPELENSVEYIKAAFKEGYDVEIDVWMIEGKLFLGHDEPTYPVEPDFLKSSYLWCHAKNLEALEYMLANDIHCFWHQEDNYTLTSDGYIWAYPGQPGNNITIAVMPAKHSDVSKYYGVCTDYPTKYYQDID